MKNIKLFDYQQEMLDNAVKALTEAEPAAVCRDESGGQMRLGNSVMVQMPTGTGKTYVMAAIVGWFLSARYEGEVWLVAHRRELVGQIRQTLGRFGVECVGNGTLSDKPIRVRVLSIQWLTRHLGDMLERGCSPGLIMVDEAHHALADTYQDVFLRTPGAMKVGMTATPCRMRKASFGKLFGRLLVAPSTADFILRGCLSPYDYVVIGKFSAEQRAVDQLKARGSDGDYAVREMDEKLNIPQAIRRLYDSVRRYADGRKGIVYAIDIDHANAIASCYKALGINAVALDSKTPAATRQRMVEAFRRGGLDCLVNVNLFDEGFDCPDVEYIQMARPTLSLAKYLQMVGRGLRVNREAPEKVCVIIDNVGNYRKFGCPDQPHDWSAMFAGVKAGKGAVPRYVRKATGIVAVEEDMVVVRKADTDRRKMTAAELRRFKESVEPFKPAGGRLMGLRSGDDTVLRPKYPFISKFTGDHAIFRLNNNRYLYGVIDRLGFVVVPPEYRTIKFLNDSAVKVGRVSGGFATIQL